MAHAKEVLIVDDEVGIRELLSEILQDEGYRVALAENASEARAYRQRQQPALVLLDIWMPDTDGVTLLREWAANGQLTMPVVMMSGHGTIETAVDATKIGAFDFLEKPIGLQKLLSTIARALKSAAVQEPRRVSLAALGGSTADPRHRAGARAAPRRAAGRSSSSASPARVTTSRRARLRRRDAPWVALANGVAPHIQSARPHRGSARRRAVLRGDRPVLEDRAEGPRVPPAQARQAERDARVHEQRAARQSRRGRQVRRGAARAARRRAR